MKALVFAAGLGTRLRPLTDTLPKALVDVNGVPLLELVIRRLAAAGADEIVINTHHFHEKIAAFLAAKNNFGLRISLSREEERPLETGGGLKKAAALLAGREPFFACNSDVYTLLDLRALYAAHLASGALATLAVRDRPSGRRLLFDGNLNLKGREGEPAAPGLRPLAFSGIQVISPAIFGKISEAGAFPIAPLYLRLAAAGEAVRGFEDKSDFWCDIGDPGRLAAVRARAAADLAGRG